MSVEQITTTIAAGVLVSDGPRIVTTPAGRVVACVADGRESMTFCPATYTVLSGNAAEVTTQRIVADAQWQISQAVVTPPPTETIDTNPATSLRANAIAAIAEPLADYPSMDVYSSQPSTWDDPTPYVRNTACISILWPGMTAISPYNSSQGKQQAGTLISKRHVLHDAHWKFAVGTVIRFVGRDDPIEVVEKTVVAVAAIPPYSGSAQYPYPDIAVAILDSDVPDSISFLKILPQDWAGYLLPYVRTPEGDRYVRSDTAEHASGICGIPVCNTNQTEQLIISDGLCFFPESCGRAMFAGQTPLDATRLQHNAATHAGDCNDPIFMVISGEMVLLASLTNVATGCDLVHFRDAVNAVMASLNVGRDCSYQLTEVNLTGFVKP